MRRHRLSMVFGGTAAGLLLGLSCLVVGATTGVDDASNWTTAPDPALRLVSSGGTVQQNPNFMTNLDCTEITARAVNGSLMQPGCYTETAFGAVNSDDSSVIFTGSDESLPLIPYLHQGTPVPWQGSGDLLVMLPETTGGVRLGVYRDPLAHMTDHRDLLGQLVSKELATPPDFLLTDDQGAPLIVNAQTLSFSADGSWLVAETLHGYFVRLNLATLSVAKFARAFTRAGEPGALASTIGITNSGRYIAVSNNNAGSLVVYDLKSCKSNSDPAAAYDDCPSHEYRPFISGQVAGMQAVRGVKFLNDDLLSLRVAMADGSMTSYVLSPNGPINNLTNYIGLGDSFTSGEGAFDYRDGSDTPQNMCHLSRSSYPLLLAQDHFGTAGGHSVACSGATIRDVTDESGGYRGQVATGTTWQSLQAAESGRLNSILADYLPGYIAQQHFVSHYQPRVVTVSVGGDDIGFGDMVRNCAEPHLSLHLSSNICYDTYEDRLEIAQQIDRTIPKWVAMYQKMQTRAPFTSIYAIGYPDIVSDTGSCGLNVHLSTPELAFALETTHYLNDAIHKAATTAGVQYVDVEHALDGHRLCEAPAGAAAVNGLTAGTDAGVLGVKVFGHESYHPNALGQELLEQAILRQTDNFRTAIPPTRAPITQQQYTNHPATGRSVFERQTGHGVTSGSAAAGGVLHIALSGTAYGLRPNTVYTVHLDGSNGAVIGTVATDSSGISNGDVTIPVTTPDGGHTIDVTGPNQTDQPIVITEPVEIGSPPSNPTGGSSGGSAGSTPVSPSSATASETTAVNAGVTMVVVPAAEQIALLSMSSGGVTIHKSRPQVLRSYTAAAAITRNPQATSRLRLVPPKTASNARLPLSNLPYIPWLLIILCGSICIYSGYHGVRWAWKGLVKH